VNRIYLAALLNPLVPPFLSLHVEKFGWCKRDRKPAKIYWTFELVHMLLIPTNTTPPRSRLGPIVIGVKHWPYHARIIICNYHYHYLGELSLFELSADLNRKKSQIPETERLFVNVEVIFLQRRFERERERERETLFRDSGRVAFMKHWKTRYSLTSYFNCASVYPYFVSNNLIRSLWSIFGTISSITLPIYERERTRLIAN